MRGRAAARLLVRRRPRPVPTIDQRVVAPLPRVKLRSATSTSTTSRRAWTRRSARTWRRSPGTAPSPTRSSSRATRTWSRPWRRRRPTRAHPPVGCRAAVRHQPAERLIWESDTVDVVHAVRQALLRARHLAEDAEEAPAAPPVVPSPTRCSRPPAQTGAVAGDHAAARPSRRSVAKLGPSRPQMEEIGEHIAHKWILTRGRDNIREPANPARSCPRSSTRNC